MLTYDIGDVVQLNSESPDGLEMTVERMEGDDKVICQWLVGTELKRGIFPTRSLTLVRPAGRPPGW
jgi:uncharacterized protein YodC (DUF2158 family)